MKEGPQKITKMKPFIRKYNWEGINYPSENDNWKKLRKTMKLWLLMFCTLKMKKYILPTFQSKTQCFKSKLLFA